MGGVPRAVPQGGGRGACGRGSAGVLLAMVGGEVNAVYTFG
jgi:hypothetical protein